MEDNSNERIIRENHKNKNSSFLPGSSSQVFESGGNFQGLDIEADVVIKEEISPDISELEREQTYKDHRHEIEIKEEPLLSDPLEDFDVSIVKKENIFVEDFNATSFEIAGEDLSIALSPEEEFPNSQVCSRDELSGNGSSSQTISKPDQNIPGISNSITETRSKDPPKTKQCNVCGKTLSSHAQLKVHMFIHTGEKPFKCEVCGKAFSDKSTYRRHSKIHTGEKPYKCDTCGKAFSDSSNLKTHKQIHSGEKPFICHVCGTAFSNSSNYRRHSKFHTEVKPYLCELCGKAFTDSSFLENHNIMSHASDKPYKCNICSKSFSNPSNFRRHSKFHSNEKNYKCNVCGKAFYDSSNYKRHLKIHTDEKPFKCNICGKAFNQLSNYRRHSKFHSNQKP